ncbi:hypothetical protein [Xanthobacter autotrophicus]|uniref:hypothetical protein n=1 Tax=Xanthobacter autotrophicus TaxID=280 RepID=UPI0037276887
MPRLSATTIRRRAALAEMRAASPEPLHDSVVLHCIWDRRAHTPAAISRHMTLAMPSIWAAARRLIEGGFLKAMGPALMLTEKGVDAAIALDREWENDLRRAEREAARAATTTDPQPRGAA